jgi:hypothetical protein
VVTVTSREIFPRHLHEQFRSLAMPLLECLDGRDIAERLLCDVLIVEVHVAREGVDVHRSESVWF